MLGLWFALRNRQSGSSSEFSSWPVAGSPGRWSGPPCWPPTSGPSTWWGSPATPIATDLHGTVELGTAICLGIAVAVLLPYYVKNQVFTIPEFLELRYRKEARLFFSGMMLVICVVTKMAFCLYAGALVLKALLGWDIMTTIISLAITTAIITMIGGFAVVAYTDAIHAPIMIAGSALVLFIGLHQVGGWEGLLHRAGLTPVPDAMHIHKPYDDPVYPFWGIIILA